MKLRKKRSSVNKRCERLKLNTNFFTRVSNSFRLRFPTKSDSLVFRIKKGVETIGMIFIIKNIKRRFSWKDVCIILNFK